MFIILKGLLERYLAFLKINCYREPLQWCHNTQCRRIFTLYPVVLGNFSLHLLISNVSWGQSRWCTLYTFVPSVNTRVRDDWSMMFMGENWNLKLTISSGNPINSMSAFLQNVILACLIQSQDVKPNRCDFLFLAHFFW